jgi:hypothetical protein
MKQRRAPWEKRNALEERKKRGCCRSTTLAIVVARPSWRDISFAENPTFEKLTKFREHLSKSR